MYSIQSYQKIIGAFLKQGYIFIPLGEEIPEDSNRTIIFRHDIDYSMQHAIRIAEVNHAMGVRACFCLQIRNVLYNLLEEQNQRAVRRILELDHKIGLHFSLPQNLGNSSEENLADKVEAMILNDMRILGVLLDIDVHPAMSWHNPSVLGEDSSHLVSRPVSGVTNAYALMKEGVTYFSDSNHRFSVEEWLARAESSPNRLHLLFHPFQWVYNSARMEEVLFGIWKDHIRTMEREFLTNHLYRAHFPKGMPEEGLDSWVEPLGRIFNRDY